MKKRLRLIITVLAIIVIAVVVAVPILRPAAVKVETSVARKGALQVTIDAEGKTRVRDKFTVTAPVGGLLKRITLRRGDMVSAGTTLAIIEPAPWGGLPSADSGQTAVLQSAVVLAPITGRVLRVMEESERVVAAGTPLLELSNTSKLEVVVDVLSTDAVKLRPGTEVLIEGWGGDAPLRARVGLIEPSGFMKVSALGIEEQRVNVIVEFVDQPGALGDGYRVEARFVVWKSDGILKIPTSALFRQGDGWCVYVVEKGRAYRRTVEVGHRGGFEVEITGGLSEGEGVILHPPNQIEEGVRVELRQLSAN
ncbi:MAG TPA: efflux RND transporter periplasmic adaptor subunit [Pyrinomonadaceae bacterium]|nr:efflux RND transporter periplasmic adaptor subunit [Pyrinomonadaceae bacterium]